jgi:hypothetical protein
VITPDATSVEAFRGLRRRFPEALLAPVHNEIFGPAQHRDKYELRGAALAQLPALAPSLRKYVETPPFSFARLMESPNVPLEAQDELERWLRRVYREFHERDLRILLADLKSAIGLGT